MYSYVLRVITTDGSIKTIRTITTNAKKSILNLVDESETDRGVVRRVLYYKRERFYLA